MEDTNLQNKNTNILEQFYLYKSLKEFKRIRKLLLLDLQPFDKDGNNKNNSIELKNIENSIGKLIQYIKIIKILKILPNRERDLFVSKFFISQFIFSIKEENLRKPLLQILENTLEEIEENESNNFLDNLIYNIIESNESKAISKTDITKFFNLTFPFKHFTIYKDLFILTRKNGKEQRKINLKNLRTFFNQNKSIFNKVNNNIEIILNLNHFYELLSKDGLAQSMTFLRNEIKPKLLNSDFKDFDFGTLIGNSILSKVYEKETSFEIPSNHTKERSLYCEEEMVKNVDLMFEKILGLEVRPLLNKYLFTLLYSLKTNECKKVSSSASFANNSKTNCLVCKSSLYNKSLKVNGMKELGKSKRFIEKLKVPGREKSVLFCRITGESIGENNEPIVLPNGQVFGKRALKYISRNGQVMCPITGKVYRVSESKKPYFN